MLKKFYLIFGALFIVIGIFLIVNSFHNITGYSVSETAGKTESRLSGMIFVFAGITSLLLARKRKRGQAAIEFLMTYGWAILATVIALGVLAYFGIFNSDSLLTSPGILNPPFYWNAHSTNEEGFTLEFINRGPEDYTIHQVSISIDGGATEISTYPNSIIASSEKMVANFPISLTHREKINIKVEIRYSKTTSQIILTSEGFIKDRVLESPPGVPQGPIIYYTLNILYLGNGAITCDGSSCDTEYEAETTITLSAISDPGYIFESWGGEGCEGQSGDCTLLMDSDKEITATFIGE